MNAKEKRKLENTLLAEGLAGLNDPELIQQLANLVSNWRGDRHEFLRDMINECEPDKRYEMYHAIAPKLSFKALSLEQYEAQIMERAGAMVSQRRIKVEGSRPHAIEIGGHKIPIVSQREADSAIVTLRCHKCSKTDNFIAQTPIGAMIEGRKAGWVRDMGLNKEICPECLPVLESSLVSKSS